jgi:hypothetical protein
LKITARVSIVMSAVFAVACFSVAITGFTSLGKIVDPAQLADARGYAWFWTFLGVVAIVFGGLGVWLVKTLPE